MMTWSEHLLSYYKNLKPPKKLPNGVEWLYPQQLPGVMDIVATFLHKYYTDEQPRKLLMGINPGRFGAGVTGVNFTAPKQLSLDCNIAHPFKMQSELSAEFIYDMINAWGGPQSFYSRFFIGSVCPLGFVQKGKNINYYDDKELMATVRPFIIKSMKALLNFHVDRSECFCIGGDKNLKFLESLNNEFHWFEKLTPLPHPRFIMQYKRKQKQIYIDDYLKLLGK